MTPKEILNRCALCSLCVLSDFGEPGTERKKGAEQEGVVLRRRIEGQVGARRKEGVHRPGRVWPAVCGVLRVVAWTERAKHGCQGREKQRKQ